MIRERIATKRHIKHRSFLLSLLCLFVANTAVFAAETPRIPDLELLSRGKPVFPTLWNAYKPIPLPPVDANNGPRISAYIREGKLALSLSEFMQLVVENNQ